MHQTVPVIVHPSESPGANSVLLREGLRAKILPQKFLYNTYGQTNRWLALHRAWSPAQRDPATVDLYARVAHEVAAKVTTPVVHVIGLGCGSAEKEQKVITAVRDLGRSALFTPLDCSLGMVLTAADNVCGQARGVQCQPLLADLPHCSTLPALLRAGEPAGAERILCLFGVLHTFEPDQLLPRILNALRSQDYLLLSANMAPENDYEAAMKEILPQYANPETYHWLEGALLQLGFERGDGRISVQIEQGAHSLSRFAAYYHLQRERSIQIEGEQFDFLPGDSIKVFFSYRYTYPALADLIADYDLALLYQCQSAQECVVLCGRKTLKRSLE